MILSAIVAHDREMKEFADNLAKPRGQNRRPG
jgi:hypothetical protein